MTMACHGRYHIIPDRILKAIPIRDNGEPLIDVRKCCRDIVIESNWRSKNSRKCVKIGYYLRETVARKLNVAQKVLPKGYNIVLYEGYRPIKIQKKMHTKYFNQLRKEHPDWSDKKLKRETAKFIAPLKVIPPHCAGAAIDLTIVGPDGKLLNMGTKVYELEGKSYTGSKRISRDSSANRKMLIRAMSKAGFVNYPTEWWHWSYGDRYWAAVKEKKVAIYDMCEAVSNGYKR